MKLVSENSESDLPRIEFSSDIARALRELAANLIRITRGAGKPYAVVSQVDELTKALIGYREVVGYWPSSGELGNALMFDAFQAFKHLPPDYREIKYATQEIIDGALQVAASRLIGQSLQEKAGDRQLYEGVNRLKEAREEHMRRWEEQRRANRKPATRTAKKKQTPIIL